MSEQCSFRKGSWNVKTSEQKKGVIVIAVPQDVADMIDSFKAGEVFGSLRRVADGTKMTFDLKTMEDHGYSRDEYSCIYTLNKNVGCKRTMVFSDSDADNLITFDGSCAESYSLRANTDTMQFKQTIQRIKEKEKEVGELHFMNESERRSLNEIQRKERATLSIDRRRNLILEKDAKAIQKDRRAVNEEVTKDEVKQCLIRLFSRNEYMTLKDLEQECPGSKAMIKDVLSEIASPEKSGKYINRYKLRDAYNFSKKKSEQ